MRSSGDQGPTRSRRAAAAAALLFALVTPALTGCGDAGGFRPLYGAAGIGAQADVKLAQVQITPIPGRVGQVIRNELIFHTTGGGEATTAAYKLEIAIRETVTSTLVRSDGEARSQLYNLDANFKLIRLSDNSTVLTGTSYGRAGFERFTSIFSNVRARQDAEDRAARTVSEDLKARLSAYLAGAA